jgi:hypothetical protein
MKISIIATAIMIGAAPAFAQEFPEFPTPDCARTNLCNQDAETTDRDTVASIWDRESPEARECALNTMKKRHMTRLYSNLLGLLLSCDEKESKDRK